MRTATLAILLVATACSFDRAEPPRKAKHTSPPVAAVEVPKPAEPAQPPPPDLSLGAGYRMEAPVKDGKLTLIPIVATKPTSDKHYLTFNEGMRKHLVTTREIGSEMDQYNVSVHNKSNLPLFVLSGEVILEGMQDRVLAEDKVIGPGETALVKVNCVEQGRSDGSRSFRSAGAIAELAIRRELTHGTQITTWKRVEEANQRLGLSPPSGTYRLAAAAQGKNSERIDALKAELAALPSRANMVGLAVALDNEIIAIDQFANPELYEKLEGELLGAYVASDFGPPREGKVLLPDDVRVLARTASTTEASTTALQKPVAGTATPGEVYVPSYE